MCDVDDTLHAACVEHAAVKFRAALVQHRKWWTPDPDRADEPDGFVAPEPLGVTVLALTVGMPVTVTSDHLPEPCSAESASG